MKNQNLIVYMGSANFVDQNFGFRIFKQKFETYTLKIPSKPC